MTPSLSQKSSLYRELGQLLKAGKPLPASMQLLHSATRGAVRELTAMVKAALDRGATAGEAFAEQYPVVSHLEASIIGAGARSGRLDQGCRYLSEYYAGLDSARKAVIRKMLYPIFLLHFTAFIGALPQLVTTGDFVAYFKSSAGVLVVIYLCCAVLGFVASMVLFEGARRTGVDRFLRMIPVYGRMRRAFALSRFCATYEMQLDSGVNVMDSLTAAARTSQSALVKEVIDRAVPQVRAGSQVGPLLAGTEAFTPDMVRTILVGEETGNLDEELKRMAHEFDADARWQLDLLGGIFSKGIYIMIMVYTGYIIISGYMGYFKVLDSLSS